MKWMQISCRKAAELMVAQEDRSLNLGERLRLGVHIKVCQSCQNFNQQMSTMRQQLEAWRQTPPDDAPGDSN